MKNKHIGTTMGLRLLLSARCLLVLVSFATQATPVADEVKATEQAFADSMANRDFPAFEAFLSEEAIFFSGNGVLRGKQAVAEHWKRFFEEAEAPFSWQPIQVEVLNSGELAHSSGPVFNSKGEEFAQFNSIWRKEKDGQWRIVFDKGQAACKTAPSE
ncbi:nuclear transport factor 2 family protein [Aliiglaciecola sp. CAU 1673]|uniref:YybH family protein n=1 Tax=Aliiglaciecola sp. CAU 1673 TaxID=3032595 RepID=UPI0023DBDFB2|nr:nuclear transport factor 2 family protein [Aliiglaciecola sp. CAU 1673]MDF2178967.1 nuclear transport factor 2 family protein [Aliiglaciecola sp. CAU 1673]